jgi:hypothetical protein
VSKKSRRAIESSLATLNIRNDARGLGPGTRKFIEQKHRAYLLETSQRFLEPFLSIEEGSRASKLSHKYYRRCRKQHFLNFKPLPHGQGSLRPTRLRCARTGCRVGAVGLRRFNSVE